ncbi:MAG: LysR substrate-binding domain-containing protein [Vulcanimicrobiaceae bacterium]
MELEWLEDFLSLAHTRSFSKSAAERNLTQPAFSRRIQAIEHWIGAALIDRSTYPTTLTELGRHFRESAQEVTRMLLLERERARARKLVEHSASMLRFSALHTLALDFFPDWLNQLEAQLGPLSTSLFAGDFHDCMQSLVEGGCDFLLTFHHKSVPLLVDPLRFPSVDLGVDSLVPVSAVDAHGEPIYSLSTAPAPVPYLAYTENTFLGRMNGLLLAQRETGSLLLKQVHESAMAEMLKAMALAGHGVAWLPASSVKVEVERGTLIVIDSAMSVDMYIRLYRSLDRTRTSVERLWTFLTRGPGPAAVG